MNPLRIFAFLALCLLSLTAAADSLRPGKYILLEGWGSLTLGADKGKGQPVAIETTGANAHVCELKGNLRKGVVVPTNPPSRPCTISIKAKGDDIELQPSNFDPEACNYYCGARATYDGTYRLPPPSCERKQLRQRQDLFLKQYRTKTYDQAHATLSSLIAECGVFYNWIDQDKLRNDLAITEYHLGRYQDCLKTLEPNTGTAHPDMESLQELPPADFDMFSTIAPATWKNRALCEKGLKAKK
ncbi:hypothetical protein D0B54_08430 [Solimonas sp. K1W22B-7]|uniref:hypothetical protein n=1 Tax=Solimonas sp. K1W22B-7 TaxID=2303331 RepID=UPI000E3375EF|nr:hypothetical protein [Solimonas sp. K1W22B-7]AXQ28704.1 hypothetical protein D0B54_08430 [Solimonas sp. K1W22B-7]